MRAHEDIFVTENSPSWSNIDVIPNSCSIKSKKFFRLHTSQVADTIFWYGINAALVDRDGHCRSPALAWLYEANRDVRWRLVLDCSELSSGRCLVTVQTVS